MQRLLRFPPLQLCAVLGFVAACLAAAGQFGPRAADRSGSKSSPKIGDSREVAVEVDRLILAELEKTGTKPAPLTNDEDFLRRVTFDLAGTLPSPAQVTMFGLDPDPDKRAKLIDRLLESDDYAQNWARYWREVIYSRATDQRARLNQDAFEKWMTAQLEQNIGWDKITTDLLTATGDVRETGETALVFAHGGQAQEIAAEASRIFLGIQIQCANCHDHPTDKWTRRQFHELAAFFPRIQVRRGQPAAVAKPAVAQAEATQKPNEERPKAKKANGKKANAKKAKAKKPDTAAKPEAVAAKNVSTAKNAPKKPAVQRTFEIVSYTPRGNNLREEFFMNPEPAIRRFDKNGDKLLSKEELKGTPAGRIFDRLLEQGDENKDQKLSAAEIEKIKPPANLPRGSAEYSMPDLNDPASSGARIDPKFFVNGYSPEKGLGDIERRTLLARYMTSKQNVWFARAYVNRIWAEMLGRGFYMPVDDMGPERAAAYPEVLDLLSAGFVDSGHDVRWLFRTIANTETYQRTIASAAGESSGDAVPFAAALPKRLRSDQLYAAISKVAGGEAVDRGAAGPRARYGPRGPQAQFGTLFGFDPSTPQDDIIGTIPQALFMMNSPVLDRMIKAGRGSQLQQILAENPGDDDAVNELYLLVLGRTATEKELKVCLEYRKDVNDRNEAFEDLFWSLLNSSEFLSQR
ncbi:MAG: DUF1549 domain-containing protein [Pirellulales bacterium]